MIIRVLMMMRLMKKVAGSFVGLARMWRKCAGFLGHRFYFMMIKYIQASSEITEWNFIMAS